MKELLRKVKKNLETPIQKISLANLRFITGGTVSQTLGSSGTGSNSTTEPGVACCDGTMVHCCYKDIPIKDIAD